MQAIVVVDYDSAWPAAFESLRSRLWPVLRGVALGIEHVGSTSVPGLAAKPIIDMTIVLPSADEVPGAIARLATLGYVHRGDLGITGREAFRAPAQLPAHHLYACPAGTLGLINPVALRDYLRVHPDAARAYGELKKSLAARFPYDVDSYVDGKTGFIVGILREVGFAPDQLAAIERMNRKPARGSDFVA
jgi:GrpB-like predicted nucleotidyltransferase (UPF0157 family)